MGPFMYLGTYESADGGLLKKILRVRDKGDLIPEAMKMFRIRTERSDVRIRLYDEEFGEFVDVDATEDLPDRGKLRFLIAENRPAQSSRASTGGTDQLHSAATVAAETSADDPDQLRSASVHSAATVSAETPADDPDQRRAASANDDLTIDVNLLSGAFRVELVKPGEFTAKHWAELIQAVFDQKVIDVYYPSKRSYATVAMNLVDQFGEKVRSSTSLSGSVDAIKQRLRTKLKNERYRNSCHDLEEERSMKRISRAASEQSRKGLPNYLPGTAAPSLEVVSAMRKLERADTDMEGDDAELLKQATFSERRRLIVHCRIPLEKLREKFCWMFSSEEIWKEFARVTSLASARGDAERHWAAVLRTIKTMCDSDSDEAAVEAFFSVLGTDICRVVGEGNRQPRLVACDDGTFTLQVEGVAVANVAGVAAATLLWAVAHTVFAQPVARGERRPANIFIQHFVLNVRDCGVVPRACWALAKRLGLNV